MKARENTLYSLIPLEDFKAVLGVDDREDKISRFCLLTATYSIEQYCKRRLLRKKHFERIEFTGDLSLPLREYPVTEVLAVYALPGVDGSGEIVEPELYGVVPDCGADYDLPFSLSFSPALERYFAYHRRRGFAAVRAVYWAGYQQMRNVELGMRNRKNSRFPVVPADLASACLELAVWNMSRYKGRRIGMTGNVRGHGKDGEHFEICMPENVRQLLEPYKRKVI